MPSAATPFFYKLGNIATSGIVTWLLAMLRERMRRADPNGRLPGYRAINEIG